MQHLGKMTIAALLLGACTPTLNPRQGAADLDRRFAGKPANEFFVTYGAPSGEFTYGAGQNVYQWVSARPSDIAVHRYRSAEGSYETVDSYTGAPETSYCALRVYTADDDTIQRFDIAVDSIGKWSGSRCSEIFSAPSL